MIYCENAAGSYNNDLTIVLPKYIFMRDANTFAPFSFGIASNIIIQSFLVNPSFNNPVSLTKN